MKKMAVEIKKVVLQKHFYTQELVNILVEFIERTESLTTIQLQEIYSENNELKDYVHRSFIADLIVRYNIPGDMSFFVVDEDDKKRPYDFERLLITDCGVSIQKTLRSGLDVMGGILKNSITLEQVMRIIEFSCYRQNSRSIAAKSITMCLDKIEHSFSASFNKQLIERILTMTIGGLGIDVATDYMFDKIMECGLTNKYLALGCENNVRLKYDKLIQILFIYEGLGMSGKEYSGYCFSWLEVSHQNIIVKYIPGFYSFVEAWLNRKMSHLTKDFLQNPPAFLAGDKVQKELKK